MTKLFKQEVYCKYCNKIIEYTRNKKRNLFCNHSCSASYNNKLRYDSSNFKVVKIPKVKNRIVYKCCMGCSVKIKHKDNNKYCSQKCKRNKDWLLRKEKIFQLSEEKSPVIAKRYLLETRGIQCEICKIIEWCGKPVPLVMDHIDGNSDNNLLYNLRLVCGNCDMQLPTYKSKNKGNGRAFRRKRYAEGKSF